MGWAGSLAFVAALALGAILLVRPCIAQAPSAVPAQKFCETASIEAKRTRLDGEAPFAGASIDRYLGYDCTVITLYRLMPKLAPHGPLTREQLLRRETGSVRGPQKGAPHFYAAIRNFAEPSSPQLAWADETTCAALLPSIEALERVLSPKFTGDGLTRGGDVRSAGVLDGVGVEVWARGLIYPLDNPSHSFETIYRSNVGAPTTDWVEATLKQLSPCLSTVQPTPDPPIP